MDASIEERFIRAFVLRERRERARFELGPAARRGTFLGRLCHSYVKVIDMRYARPVPAGHDPAMVAAELRCLGAPRRAYVLSSDKRFDGIETDLVTALDGVFFYGLPSVVLCQPDCLAYFQAEQEYGPPPRFLLMREPASLS
jgi:hypothetical protein